MVGFGVGVGVGVELAVGERADAALTKAAPIMKTILGFTAKIEETKLPKLLSAATRRWPTQSLAAP